jgi:hypothetical protein
MARRGTIGARRGTIGASSALLLAAVALFLIGAFVTVGGVDLIALGLVCFAGSFLVR